MKPGLGWVEVSHGRSVLGYDEVEITFRSIWLRLGTPIHLGTSEFLMMRVCFGTGPGGDGGSPTMMCVFSYITTLAEIGFSLWLPLGNGQRFSKPNSPRPWTR